MPLLLRIALAVVAWAVSEPLLLDGTASLPEALAFSLALSLPLLATRRAPVLVGAVVVAVYDVQYAVDGRMDAAMSPELALAFALYGVAAYAPVSARRTWAAVPLAAAVPAGLWLASAVDLGEVTSISSSWYLYATAVAAGGVLPGLALRERRAQVAGLEAELTTLLERTPLLVDRAVADERLAVSRRATEVVQGLVADLSGLVGETRAALPAGRAAAFGRRMADAAGAAGDELRSLLQTLHAAPATGGGRPWRARVDWRSAAGLAFPVAGLAVLTVWVWIDVPDLPVTIDVGTGPLHFRRPGVGDGGALLWSLLTPAALLLRRRAPLLAVAFVGALLVGGELLHVFSSLTITPVFICGVLAYTAGAYPRSLREALAAGAAVLATAGSFWALEEYHFGPVVYVYMVAVLIGTWLVGRATRDDLRDASVLRERAAVLRRQRDRLCDAAVRGERRDVARELHDVVGHALSLIAVQSGVVSVLAERDTRRAAGALDVIDDATRTVAAELDGLRLALAEPDLERVVADARAAGQAVTLSGDAGDLGDARPVAARIVREALTNARKHAHGAAAHVVVRAAGNDVEVEVVNGPGEPLAGSTGTGLGVRGMAERAAALGGGLEAGPDGAGGWRVRAWLPSSAAEGDLAAAGAGHPQRQLDAAGAAQRPPRATSEGHADRRLAGGAGLRLP